MKMCIRDRYNHSPSSFDTLIIYFSMESYGKARSCMNKIQPDKIALYVCIKLPSKGPLIFVTGSMLWITGKYQKKCRYGYDDLFH